MDEELHAHFGRTSEYCPLVVPKWTGKGALPRVVRLAWILPRCEERALQRRKLNTGINKVYKRWRKSFLLYGALWIRGERLCSMFGTHRWQGLKGFGMLRNVYFLLGPRRGKWERFHSVCLGTKMIRMLQWLDIGRLKETDFALSGWGTIQPLSCDSWSPVLRNWGKTTIAVLESNLTCIEDWNQLSQ